MVTPEMAMRDARASMPSLPGFEMVPPLSVKRPVLRSAPP
jgi:hypothetical protein